MRNFYFLLALVLFSSCKPEIKPLTAQQIIDKSIKSTGTDRVSKSIIEFEFRKRKYVATRNNGKFLLERISINDSIIIHDKLSNNGFERYINEEFKIIQDSLTTLYSGSVNSVHYFSVLPFGLNDAAVKKKLLKETTIQGKLYYKVQISFAEDGGGEDFDDVFIYWIGKEDFKLDYLAYSYHVNGGGMRFRVATNERFVKGIRFVDYNNFKSKNASTKLENLDEAFENSGLKKLSEINLENVQVELID